MASTAVCSNVSIITHMAAVQQQGKTQCEKALKSLTAVVTMPRGLCLSALWQILQVQQPATAESWVHSTCMAHNA